MDDELQTIMSPIGTEIQLPTSVPTPVGADARFRDNAPVEPEVKSSFGDLAEAAKDDQWIIRDKAAVERMFREYTDGGERVGEAHWQALQKTNEYDNDQLEAFRDLVDAEASIDEWDDLMEEFAITNNARKVVAEHGMTGVGASMAAAVADPTFLGIGAGAAVSGQWYLAPILAGLKVKRTARLAALGIETLVAEGAAAGLRSQTTSDYGEQDAMMDLLTAVAITGAFDGAINAKAGMAAYQAEKHQAEQMVRSVESNDAPLDAGAKQTKGDAGVLRFDDYGVMANSDNTFAREFADAALQDSVKGGSHSASVLAQRGRDHYVGLQNAAFRDLWIAHKKNFKGGIIKQAQEMNRLSEQVWEAVVLGADHGPEIAKVAKVVRQTNSEILEEAKRSGLNGFKDLDANEFYMRQQWDSRGWRMTQIGTDGLTKDELVELIHRGLNFEDVPLSEQLDNARMALDEHHANVNVKKAEGEGEVDPVLVTLQKEVDDIEGLIEARKRLATGFVNRMVNRADGETQTLSDLLDEPDSLVKWLREDGDMSNATDAEIEAFVKKALSSRNSDSRKNIVDRAKRRITIDPAAEFVKGGKTHRVADLMVRDAMGLQQSYIHEMTGNIAFARRMGFKGPADWMEFKQNARAKEIELNRERGDAEKRGDKLVQQLDEMRREVFGHNRYELTSTPNRWTSALMKYNFLTMMGKAAFSATSEMGRILGENRVRNVLKVVPSLHKLVIDSFSTSTKHNSLVKEVNAFNASIGDEYLLKYFNDFDETGIREGRFTDGMLNKTEVVAHRATRLMSKASLLAPMDKALRLLSFQSSMNALYSHLIKGQKARLAFDEMGMSKELRDRIKANMKTHGVDTDAYGNVTKLNIEKWDRKTADDMMDALTVNGARQVQKTFSGENTWITSHPIGRVFLQFRKFGIDALAKYLRADIHSARNGAALRVMLSNSYAAVFATLGYLGRTHISTIGMSDEKRQEYLEERLETKRLLSNVAAYTPSIGPLVSAWNSTGGFMYDPAAIPVARATTLANSGLESNPTLALFQRSRSLFHNVHEADPANAVDRTRFLIPLQNTIWGDAMLNTLSTMTK